MADIPRFVVLVPPPMEGNCQGCKESEEPILNSDGNPISNDQLIECPNGTTGATIVLSDEVRKSGLCYWQPHTGGGGHCAHTQDKCSYDVKFKILFTQNSCLGTIWVSAPGTPGPQPIGNSWPDAPAPLHDEAACDTIGHEGSGQQVAIYADQQMTQLLGFYGFKVKCTSCPESQ